MSQSPEIVDLTDDTLIVHPTTEEAVAARTGTFELKAKNIALTYAQCPIPADIALELLKDLFSAQKPVFIQVSQEHHQDGEPHLHVLACLSGLMHTRDARFADLECESSVYHPNVKRSWNIRGWKEYISKEGWVTAVYGAFESVKLPGRPKGSGDQEDKEKMNARVARKINSGSTVDQLLKKRKYQGFLLTNLGKTNYFAQQLAMLKHKELMPWPKIRSSLSYQNSTILRWLGMNLFEQDRPLRTKQLYLVSDPGMGKTSLALTLAKCMKTYFPSLGEKYFDGLMKEHDLMIFDEFAGTHPLGIMNQILDGQQCILPQRYQCFAKTRNIPVIILSNLQPYDCYRKASPKRVAAFVDRLVVVEIHEFISIFE